MKPATETDYRKRIARVVAAILADPAAPHPLDELGRLANFSPFHFHRVYRRLAGESVGATVRRVRLIHAAERLAAARDPVIAVALDAGYDNPQSFARAFRDFTHMSPSDFRRCRERPAVPSAAAETALLPVAIGEQPAVRAHGLRHDGPYHTIGRSFERLRQWQRARGLSPGAYPTIGFAYPDPADRKGIRYYAGLVLPPSVPHGDGVELCELPGGLYGSHRLIGPYGMIETTFRLLFGSWLPTSRYARDARPALELYCRDGALASGDMPVTDLLIPLRLQ
jgi:AraC family transcriptional regulator